MPVATIVSDPVTLVFCHYLAGSSREWSGVASHLDPSLHVMSLDLPGFGDASSIAGYSVDDMVRYVSKQIRGRSTKLWALVGHSMGAKVSAAIARHAEDGAAGLDGLVSLILVAGSPPSPEPMDDSKRAEMLAMFQHDDASSLKEAEKYVADNCGSPLDALSRQVAVEDALRIDRAAWAAWLQSGSKEDWGTRVGLLRTPALVIAGEKDAALGSKAQRELMLPHLQAGTLIELAGAGHLIPLERPKELAELIQLQIRAALDAGVGRSAALVEFAGVLASKRVGQGTRSALSQRLSAHAGHSLDHAQLHTLRALANCLVPETSRDFDLGERIAETLGKGQGDGWRPAALPADVQAYQQGLATLDAEAKVLQAADFATLSGDLQQQLLRQVALGQSTRPGDQLLNATQMRAWFDDVRADAARLYLAHPETLARIGYSGVANGGDGLPKTGFVKIGLGLREAWEPVGQASKRT